MFGQLSIYMFLSVLKPAIKKGNLIRHTQRVGAKFYLISINRHTR